ncbi:MAG: nucleoside-diphosphate-sugar epimerase [Cellvibrionaceae bacterium]|jgi:nucleoside-diphosphate-sugar epimerase
MKIAVTGGSGDLGRNLIPYLLDQGHSVVSIDRSIPTMTFPRPKKSPDYFAADITDFGEVVAVLSGCDAIIHLAAYRSPLHYPDPHIYSQNTTGSYNILYAASVLGIKRVCLASSINAIGGAFSRSPQYDYFPVDEEHPTYAEDPYSLSKWVLEQQADAFARRYEWMTIASLRFHWLTETRERVVGLTSPDGKVAIKHLWAYTLSSDASRACLLSLTADFSGHEAFYIVAPSTAVAEPSRKLAEDYFPNTPLRSEMANTSGFFDCSKAERLLGWRHEDGRI